MGVFRARYWQQGEAGAAIEAKLRGSEDHGWATTLGQRGGRPPAGPPRPRFRATIASTEKYGAEKERASVDRVVERMLVLPAQDSSDSSALRFPRVVAPRGCPSAAAFTSLYCVPCVVA